MCEAYLAQDTKLDRQMAIRVLPETLRNGPDHLARFRRGAKAAASLQHNNNAIVFSLEEGGDTHLIMMEYADGEKLSDVIPDGGLDVNIGRRGMDKRQLGGHKGAPLRFLGF